MVSLHPVKNAIKFLRDVHIRVIDWFKEVKKTFFKKNQKTIVRVKKGFYICTRLARKRVKRR